MQWRRRLGRDGDDGSGAAALFSGLRVGLISVILTLLCVGVARLLVGNIDRDRALLAALIAAGLFAFHILGPTLKFGFPRVLSFWAAYLSVVVAAGLAAYFAADLLPN